MFLELLGVAGAAAIGKLLFDSFKKEGSKKEIASDALTVTKTAADEAHEPVAEEAVERATENTAENTAEDREESETQDKRDICFECMQQGLAAEQSGDFEQAYQMFSEAAEAGNPVAAYFIGNMYYHGKYGILQVLKTGAPIMPWDSLTQAMPNYKKAFDWYLKAAEGGYAHAMNNVGVLYHFGQGVEKDEQQSKRWLLEAVDAGAETAKQALKDFFNV